jgi:PAS domain S-box-containing protein
LWLGAILAGTKPTDDIGAPTPSPAFDDFSEMDRYFGPPCIRPLENHLAHLEKLDLIAAIEQTAEAIMVTDASAIIRYVNPAFTHITGYTSEEAIGRNTNILKSGMHDKAFYQDMWSTIHSGQAWRGELINRRKDGSLYMEEATISRLRDILGSTTGYIAVKQDVTKRRAAEQAQKFLASIVESSKDAIIGRTPEGIIVSWNQGAENLFGYSAQEIIGQRIAVLAAPEMVRVVEASIEKTKKGEPIVPVDGVALAKDGRRIDVSASVSAVKDEQGKLVAVASILRDITERKRAEDARSLLAAVVESSEDAIIAVSPDKKVVAWNKGAQAIYGYTAEEVLGNPTFTYVPLDRREEFDRMFETVLLGETVARFESTRNRKDGSQIEVALTFSPIKNSRGDVIGVSGIVRDITQSKATQRSLHEAEERYRTLVHNIPDVVWMVDQEQRCTFVTPNVEKMLGVPPDEFYKRGSQAWFECVHPDDVGEAADKLAELFATRKPFDVK